MPKKIAFPFDWEHSKDTDIVSLLGGKGANLHRMTVELGMPVPEGFTIPTDQSLKHAKKNKPSASLAKNLVSSMSDLESRTGRSFGGTTGLPLLVSVRSGAPISMPGMMETILNLGLNDDTVKALASNTNERFALDSYMRFIKMFGVIVHGHPADFYDSRINATKRFAATDTLDVDSLNLLIGYFKENGPEIPSDPAEQLEQAVMAVFKSWDADKAKSYRKIEGIPDDLGTAVNVQRMVFGNMNDQSATGVAFTRNPNTGENVYFGDFLPNAQGEDVVDGSTVTKELAAMGDWNVDLYRQLTTIMDRLETHYRDMCDIEFTIENGTLFMLQTRTGKRNPDAAIRMAFNMYDEGLIDIETAIDRVLKVRRNGVVNTGEFSGTEIGTGLAASPGVAIGKPAFTSKQAVEMADNGIDCVLVTHETSPTDIEGMAAAQGVLTAVGGLVSHAAVVARGWGKPCVVGLNTMSVTPGQAVIGDHTITKDSIIKIDGATGQVFVS